VQVRPGRADGCGVDDVQDGWTPLHQAALINDVERATALLDVGADPNAFDRDRTTPLHIAAQSWSLGVAELLLSRGAVVDPPDVYGKTPLAVAVMSSKGRGDLIQLLRAHQADPYLANHYGQTPVGTARLIANYDIAQYFADLPVTPVPDPTHGPVPGEVSGSADGPPRTGIRHFDEARRLWQAAVPGSGQADTVQGELLRAVEKLRDEAQRNGNQNWDHGFDVLLEYLRTRLLDGHTFGGEDRAEIDADLAVLANYGYPHTGDDVYDRLADRAVEWTHAHPDPIRHEPNPNPNHPR
jgi:hypothetical protein